MRPRLVFVLILILFAPSMLALALSSPTVAQSIQTKEGSEEIKSLLQQGFQQLYTSQHQAAIASFEKAIAKAQKAGDRSLEAAALLGLSEANPTHIGEESLRIAQQALKIYQDLKDRAGEAEALHLIGDAQLSLGQNEASLKTLDSALAIRKEVKDRQGEAWTLGILGIVQFLTGQKTGLASMQQALAVLKEPVARTEQARQSYRQVVLIACIGLAQIQQKQIELGKKTLQEALTLGKKTGNLNLQKLALAFTAILYVNQKQPKEAIATYKETIILAQQLDSQSEQAFFYKQIGDISKQLGQYAEAQQAYEKAVTLYQVVLSDTQKRSARVSEGIVQGALGDIYFNQGGLAYDQKQYQSAISPYTKALQPFEQALIISKELNTPSQIKKWQRSKFGTYYAIVNSYNNLKQYELALAANQKMQDIAKEIGDPQQFSL
jgi:tetratricopeptide (TPR) repeat protein